MAPHTFAPPRALLARRRPPRLAHQRGGLRDDVQRAEDFGREAAGRAEHRPPAVDDLRVRQPARRHQPALAVGDGGVQHAQRVEAVAGEFAPAQIQFPAAHPLSPGSAPVRYDSAALSVTPPRKSWPLLRSTGARPVPSARTTTDRRAAGRAAADLGASLDDARVCIVKKRASELVSEQSATGIC